jgi:hypothetical protein
LVLELIQYLVVSTRSHLKVSLKSTTSKVKPYGKKEIRRHKPA